MLALLLAAAAAPIPGTVRVFADWAAGCDNGRACRAVALVPPRVDRSRALMLVVRRSGMTGAAASLVVPIDRSVAPGSRLTLAVDGKPVAQIVAPGGGDGLALPLGPALVAALSSGRGTVLRDAAGRPLARASLAGFGAATRWMDGEKRGNSAAPLPVVVAAAGGDGKPRAPRGKESAALSRSAVPGCAETASVPRRPVRLDPAHTLLAIDHVCAGVTEVRVSALFLVDEHGHATPAPLDAAAGPDDQPGNLVVGGGWDAASRRLTSDRRDGPAGDCGRTQSFAWDGERFRLVAQADMRPCRGAAEFIPTWRADVAGR